MKGGRLIRTPSLETKIQLYAHEGGGEASLELQDMLHYFGADSLSEQDMTLLRRLSELGSFDPYSIQAAASALGLDPALDCMRLPPEFVREIQAYHMDAFKRPMMQFIYDEAAERAADCPRLDQLSDAAREKLHQLARRMDIPVHSVPAFLDDYQQSFLSVGCHDAQLKYLAGQAEKVLIAMDKHAASRDATPKSADAAAKTVRFIGTMLTDVGDLVHSAKQRCRTMWRDITARSYAQLKRAIVGVRPQAGAILSALTAKLDGWISNFGSGSGASGQAQYLVQAMLPGIGRFRRLPMLA